VIMNYLMVAVGGALGAVARYAVYNAAAFFKVTAVYATLAVNTLGALVIGVLYVVLVERGLGGSLSQSLWTVGFLGAFTTYSTYSLDAWRLVEQGNVLAALLYLLATMVLCLVATWVGLALARAFTM
jgi:fluoride exporter